MNHSTKKIIPILLISVFLISLVGIFTPAYATSSIIFQNDPAGAPNSGTGLAANHPSASAYDSAFANNFHFTQGNYYITQVEVWLFSAGAPDGNIYAEITGVASQSGTANPNMSDVKTTATNSVSMAGVTVGSYSIYQFYFPGTFQCLNNTYYSFVFYADNATNLGDTNHLYDGQKNSQSNLDRQFEYKSSAWTGSDASDISIRVYADVSPAPTPTPSPTPTPAPTYSLSDQYHLYDEDTLVQLTGVQNATVPWIIDYNVTQGQTYDFAGIVFNNSIPTGISGTLEIWRTALYNGTADLNPITSSYNSVYNDMNAELNQYPPNGTGYIYHDTVNVTDGTAYFDVDPIYTYGSQVSYQGYLLYYNITGNADDPYEGWLMHHWIIGAYDPVYLAGGLPTAAPTATPDQIGNYIPDPSGGAISAIVNYLIALLVILLPAGILGVLFKFGAWGFITGMAIGSGIGYLLLFDVNGNHVVPLWLVFLIVIGTVGMLMKGYVGKGGGDDE